MSRPAELVSREEIRDQIWGAETSADFEHGLNFAIKKIRDTLDDDSETRRYIETLPGRGYGRNAANSHLVKFGLPVKSSQYPHGLNNLLGTQSLAESQNDSGAKPEIVLSIVVAVEELRQKVLGLSRADRDVPGYPYINAASGRHPERRYGTKSNSIFSPDTPKKNLGERRDLAVP